MAYLLHCQARDCAYHLFALLGHKVNTSLYWLFFIATMLLQNHATKVHQLDFVPGLNQLEDEFTM
jgi:hypothetical protein